MSPQMGVVTDADLAAAVAAEAVLRAAADAAEAAARLAADNAHAALTVTHGTVDDIADQTDIENHRLDADAHHPEEIPEGRATIAAGHRLVVPGITITRFSTSGILADYDYYMPIMVRTPITLANLFFEVTAAGVGGTRMRIGLWTADIEWQPVTLVGATGELAVDGVAVVSTAFVYTLQEGRYVIITNTDGTPTLRDVHGEGRYFGAARTMGATMLAERVLNARAYAAFPEPMTLYDTVGGAGWNVPYHVFCDIGTP